MTPRVSVPTATAGQSSSRRRPVRKHAWSRPWSWVQLVSHVAVVFNICCFAIIVHDDWRIAGAARSQAVMLFWGTVLVTFALYFYVCLVDVSYRECPVDLMSDEYEPRRCEECDTRISHVRAKHCHMCNKCIAGFDHHCRYLNACIGEKNYRPWACFVSGLLILMATCLVGAVDVLSVGQTPTHEYVLGVLMAILSTVLTLFLGCLLSQHLYLFLEGLTTLEYVKNQNPCFPALPPQGWRERTQFDRCYNCDDTLELIEVDNSEEVWYCTVCQTDLSKAQVPFLHCESCGDVSVCMLCKRIAARPDQQVVTSKISTLRREPTMPVFGSGGNALRIPSSSSSLLRKAPPRRMLSSLVASVEGGTGDKEPSSSFCGGRRGNDDSSDSGSSDSEDAQS